MKDDTIQVELGAATQPRVVFKPGSWVAKIDFINHLILFNNVLIAVLAEKEGGKTCFSTLLQNNLDQQVKSVTITLTPPCDRQVLIDDICSQLHLNNDPFTDIDSIVAQVNERKAHVLIVIDNAQHLQEELIKEAMQAIKKQDSFGFFHLCILSDYSVIASLNRLAVEQFDNLIHTIELGNLNEAETRTYVLQRAMNARLINRPLTDAQFKQFYQLTKGNLAKINSSLEQFIFKSSNQTAISPKFNLKKASMAVSAVVVAAVSYLYVNNLDEEPVKPIQAAIKQVINKVRFAAENHKQLPTADTLISQIPSWQDSSTRQLVHFALPKKQVLDEYEELYPEETINTVALVDKVLAIPTIKAKAEPRVAGPKIAAKPELPAIKALQSLTKTAVLNTKAIAPVLAVKPAETDIPVSVIAAISPNQHARPLDATVKSTKTVSAPSANKFTIQIAASHKEEDVTRFMKSNKLFAKATVRHFTNDKGTWYILTMGEYSTINQAQARANKLPPEIAKLNPWIRPVSGLTKIG